jgi:hypothetical protein
MHGRELGVKKKSSWDAIFIRIPDVQKSFYVYQLKDLFFRLFDYFTAKTNFIFGGRKTALPKGRHAGPVGSQARRSHIAF